MEGCNFPRGKGKRKRNGEREEGDIGGSVARGNLIRRIIQTQEEFIFAGTPIIRDFWWIGSIINSSERSFLSRNGDWLYIKRTGSRGNECTYTCNECLNSNRRFPSAGWRLSLKHPLGEFIPCTLCWISRDGNEASFSIGSIDVKRSSK